MSSIIAQRALPLHALAVAAVAGVTISFRSADCGQSWWRVDARDPQRTVVYVDPDLDEDGLAAELPGILGALGQLAERRRRRGLRALEPAAKLELTEPARPVLHVLVGGALKVEGSS